MTKIKFKLIEKKDGFNSAMDLLCNESDCITTYDRLKEYAIYLLEHNNTKFALFILNSICNSDVVNNWYYYDYTAGSCCTPVSLVTFDDVENYIGFKKN